MYRLWEALRIVAGFIYPHRCPFCDGVIQPNEYWCEECYAELIFVDEQTPPENLSGLYAVCEYRGVARDAILRMKAGEEKGVAEGLGVLMRESVGFDMEEYDLIVPVPSSLISRIKRGYVPAELLARQLSHRSGIKVRRALSMRSGRKIQKGLTREQRRENSRISFEFNNKLSIKGLKILLVDDVCTTGSTLSACAELLLNGGAATVTGAVFAKTPLK